MSDQWRDFTIDAAIPEWAQRMAPIAEQAVRDTAPVRDGGFVASIQATATSDSVDVEGSKVGKWLAEGTQAHGPASAPVMRFYSRGQWWSKHEVAGIAPNDYLDRAIEVIAEQAGDELLAACSTLWDQGA